MYGFTQNDSIPTNFSSQIAIVGDVGLNDNSLSTLQNIDSHNPDLIIFAGDLSYTSPDDWFEFSDFLDPSRILIAIGNHDVSEKNNYLTHYELNSEFYSYNFNKIHFVILSAESSYGINSMQYDFVLKDFKKIMKEEIKWIVVVIHQPLYTDSKHPENIGFRNIYQPIFDKHDVDLVIQGHNHVYERSNPIKFNNTITDESITFFNNPDGQIYVTVGTGGYSNYDFNHTSDWSVQQQKTFGFLSLFTTENDNVLNAQFISNSGRILDSFQIIK